MSSLLEYAVERRKRLEEELKKLNTFIEVGEALKDERDGGKPAPAKTGAGSDKSSPMTLGPSTAVKTDMPEARMANGA